MAQAYTVIAGKLKEADPHAAEILAKLQWAIGTVEYPSDELGALAEAYAAVEGMASDAGPQRAEVLTGLREAISKGASYLSGALVQGYAAVAGKLKEGDPIAAEELPRLREAIGKKIPGALRNPRPWRRPIWWWRAS